MNVPLGPISLGFGAFALHAWALHCIRRQLNRIEADLEKSNRGVDALLGADMDTTRALAAITGELRLARAHRNEMTIELTDAIHRAESDVIGALTKTKEAVMAGEQAILDRVKAEATVIESVRVLVQALKDAADDPVKTAEILAALDANDAALAVIQGTPAEPPTA